MDLKDQIKSIEDLPSVWTPTAPPQVSSFLRDLIALPQQYTPGFGQLREQQADFLSNALDVKYSKSELDQYGPAGPGISPELKSLLQDVLQQPQQSSATSTFVTPDVAAQPFAPASRMASVSSGTLTDVLHLELALLNVALDGAEATTSSEPPAPTVKFLSPVAEPRSRGQTRILVVDDDRDVGRVTSAFLRKAGFEVITVGSGDEALAVLSADPGIDTLVTDYAMVGMNGVELVLQARELRTGLRALVITGYVGAEGLERVPNNVAVLRKPFQRDSFVQQVINLVEGTTPSDDAKQNSAFAASVLNELARS